jgi:hypothetical protein
MEATVIHVSDEMIDQINVLNGSESPSVPGHSVTEPDGAPVVSLIDELGETFAPIKCNWDKECCC